MRVRIPTDQWMRAGTSQFYENGISCIVGWIFRAQGVPTYVLDGIGSLAKLPAKIVIECLPAGLIEVFEHQGKPYAVASTDFIRIIDINDNGTISDDERKDRLTMYLGIHGFDLEFIDPTPVRMPAKSRELAYVC